MTAALRGKVAIVTGAAGGLGREYCRELARQGASIVVNDVGEDGSPSPAVHELVEEVRATGVEAVASAHDVSDWRESEALVLEATERLGDLHILVNSAGLIRDRMLVNMSDADFDEVIRVHVRGTFCPLRWAATFWRSKSKATGKSCDAAAVITTSNSGLHGSVGQVNYGAAKAALAAMTQIAASELGQYGVRVNAIAPFARTSMTQQAPELAQALAAPTDGTFDRWHPANVAPLVAYLCQSDCAFTGQVFSVFGGSIGLYQGWSVAETISSPERWTAEDLSLAVSTLPTEVPVRRQTDLLAL